MHMFIHLICEGIRSEKAEGGAGILNPFPLAPPVVMHLIPGIAEKNYEIKDMSRVFF